jgi:hypothetical protein
MTRRLAPAVMGALLVTALLAGCTAAPQAASPTPTPAASESPTPPAGSAEPTTAPVDETTCDDVLTDDEYAQLASSGLTFREDAFPLGPAMSDLIDDGALHCVWAAEQSDVALWVARLPESDEAWTARQAELLAAGWTEGDDPFPDTLTAPADYDANYVPSIVHVDGVTYFVSTAEVLTSIADLA